MDSTQSVIESVKDYYGKVLSHKDDLQTTACCTDDSLPKHVKEILPLIHDDVVNRFYGCGSPLPSALEGITVLDLGCGTGRDCYLLSKLVGENGRVIGVDMTGEQLAVANAHREYHAEAFGYSGSNVEFHKGYIEDLGSVGVADTSVDLVVSNCVINLSPAKDKVFSEIFRVLKEGGELYFSDVFASRRLNEEQKTDPVLLGECLGGAMYIEDFRRLLAELGCLDFRIVSQRKLHLRNCEIEEKTSGVDFYSITIRAFKLSSVEDRCENYGQVATYKGTIEESPHVFVLDDHHVLEAGLPMLVCGNTASMLAETRYRSHFEVQGDRSKHFGLFDCAPAPKQDGEIQGCC